MPAEMLARGQFSAQHKRAATGLALFVVVAVAAWPLWAGHGLLNTRGGGDSPFLLQRTQQLVAALLDGHFPARWMPDANYGYGYPFFNFYAPLSIYLAAAFRLWGWSLVRAVQLAQLAGFAVAAWGMFRLGRRWFGGGDAGTWAGLLAAAAYTVAPFHLVNVYVRGDSLAEFWAMAFYPLTILAAEELLARPGARQVTFFALAYAGLVLSHNISALIFSPFLLLYLLWRWPGGGLAAALRHYRRPLAGLLLGLALSAWFWLPALAERHLAQLGPVTSGYFSYANHFRGADLVQGSLLFDFDVAGGKAFRMGLLQALSILASLVALWWPGAGRLSAARRGFITLALLLATFMILPASRPLWDHLPLLPFVQFPWRFLSVQAFAGALAVGGLARLPWRPWLVPAILLALLLASLAGLRPDYLSLADGDITPYRLAAYEWFTGNIGTTVSAEYLPPAVQPRPQTSAWLNSGQRDRAQVLGGAATAQRVSRRAARQMWQVEVAGDAATLLLPTLYWPGWQARLDGAPLPLEAAPGSGLMRVTLPAGSHRLDLALRRTPVRLGAELASLLALALALWLLRPGKLPRRALLPALALLLGGGLLLHLWPRPSLPPDDLTWDFAQMGYLHHDADGVPFSNGARLLRYRLGSDELAAGESLPVTLSWEGAEGAAVSLALAWPAANRLERVPLLAAQRATVVNGRAQFSLPLPPSAPAGLYLPRLTLEGAVPLLPSGQSRGTLYLRPVRLKRGGEMPAPSPRPFDLQLAAAWLQDETLHLQVRWWAAAPLASNEQVSWRLANREGNLVYQFDAQPGYGFQPATLWPAGQWVNDWLALPLPPLPPEGAPYALSARLYDVATGQVRLARRLGEVAGPGTLAFRETRPAFDLPPGLSPLSLSFGGEIALRGYRLEQDGPRLLLTLVWQALQDGRADAFHFVHLIDPKSGQIVAQHDSRPQQGSYPTGQWLAGQVVADPVPLDLTGLPPGSYRLAVGLYQKQGEDLFPRLPARDAAGNPLPDDRFLLPEPVVIP